MCYPRDVRAINFQGDNLMQISNHQADSTFSKKTDSEHKELGWRESVCIKSPSRAFPSTTNLSVQQTLKKETPRNLLSLRPS